MNPDNGRKSEEDQRELYIEKIQKEAKTYERIIKSIREGGDVRQATTGTCARMYGCCNRTGIKPL